MIELIVVLVVTTIIAAILTPMLTDLINEARVTRAQLETLNISRAIGNFNKSTGKWPIFKSGVGIGPASDYYEILVTPGTLPASNDAEWLPAGSEQGDLGDILDLNAPGYGTNGRFAWRGPYTIELAADPWGNAYIVSAKSLRFGVKKAAMVLSAGANGLIETTFDQDLGSGAAAVTVGGDDIVSRIR